MTHKFVFRFQTLALSIYNVFLILFSPAILLSYLIKLYKRPDYRDRWAERLGRFPTAKRQHGLHIHAVSLGETKVAAKVVSKLLEQHPALPIVFTCSTATASEFIQRQFGDQVDHCYLPFDFPWVVARFLNRYQPKVCVITEVEWWPNLICQNQRRGSPVVMINVKMTDSSARTYLKFESLFHTMAAKVTGVLVQNQASYDRLLKLGISEEKLTLTNNIKFDEQAPRHFPSVIEQLRTSIIGRPVWIAGSTHAEDEAAVFSAFNRLKNIEPSLLLILVPRHPERFNSVYQTCLSHNHNTARRSTNDEITADTDILLGDTLGELSSLYSLADMAFIGGSITDRGGHNPLEAAIYGIPLIMGPSQFNAIDIVESLTAAGALTVIDDADSLYEILARFIKEPEVSRVAGQSSASAMEANQGALQQTTDYLNQLLLQHNIH